MTRLLVLPCLTLALLAAACGQGAEPEPASAGAAAPRAASTAASMPASMAASTSPSPSPAPSRAAELPRGGRTIFPQHVVVMHYGTAGTDALGVLGQGTPAQAAARLEEAAAPFGPASGRTVLPAFELIATVAQKAPGKDGDYSEPLSAAEVQTYLDAARTAKVLLVLDLQPGRATLLEQAKLFQRFLEEPDVGLAVDPEWKLQPGQQPGEKVGYVTVEEINAVSSWLAGLTRAKGLPEKVFMVHQFQEQSVRPDNEDIAARPGLATVVHADGFGPQSVKKETYAQISLKSGPLHNGFKLFYDKDNDPDLMTPAQVMALRPRPELITYQ